MNTLSLQLEAVLILTSNFHDSQIAADVLREHGIGAFPCAESEDLFRLASEGCGTVLLSEDALKGDEVFTFQSILKLQEAWSDIPVILITSKSVARASELFSTIGNVSFLEAPFSRVTLVRAIEVALRARRKQYQTRDLLKDLKKSKEEAEKANASKTEFLANMSHEIRSPIGAILGFLELMKESKNKHENIENYMGIVERNSEQLLRLIDDILDLSKVEAGKMTIEQVPFALGDLLADISSIMSFKAAEKGIAFLYIEETPIPDQVSSDPVRLRQILGNVLSNAIKFTTRGFVKLQVEMQNDIIQFTIQDTGVGISEDQEKKLFKPFSQADMSTTRKFGGTGLGLILSKRLSQAMGGDLVLKDSEFGKGSTFVIKIKPIPVEGAKLIGKPTVVLKQPMQTLSLNVEALKDLNILVVEDSPDNQMLIYTLLSTAGAKVSLAENGEEGVELALKENFDIVLMDVQMPILDGHRATQKLRAMNYAKPIIALTAHAMEEEKRKCFESGYTEFLTKPIRRDQLMELLSQYAK